MIMKMLGHITVGHPVVLTVRSNLQLVPNILVPITMTGLHIIQKKIMLRDKIKVTVKWKDALSSKIKICVTG